MPPVARDNPYGSFNFRVTVDKIGGGNAESIAAGFQEISGLGMEVSVAEYRNGNEKRNHTRKMNGLLKASDLTLKRGVIGRDDIFRWLDEVARGVQDAVRPSMTIQLMDEAGKAPVMTWKLINVRPMKYTGVTMNAKTGTDVAMEELVLSYERLELE